MRDRADLKEVTLRGELVSFPANRLNPSGTLRIIELLAQPRDVHIHGPRIDFAVVLPHLMKNFLARQNAIAVEHQILQELQFFRCQGKSCGLHG
jgi:hypothetical protein